MPGLSRDRFKPLLRIVNNKPHASSDDHEEPPVPPRKESGFKTTRPLETSSSSSSRLAGDFKKRPENQLPLSLPPREPLRTSPRKRERVIDLCEDSPPKKLKLGNNENLAPLLSRKSQAEKSLPSPESIERRKRRVSRMQTETDFEADPLSSSDGEQPPIVAGSLKNTGNGTTSTRGRSGVGSVKAPAGGKSGCDKSTKRTRSDTGDDAKPGTSAGQGAAFKRVEVPNFLSSRKNDSRPQEQFRKPRDLDKIVGDEELEDDDDDDDGDVFGFKNIHGPDNKKRRISGLPHWAPKKQVTYAKKQPLYGTTTRRRPHIRPPPKTKKAPEAPKPRASSEVRFKRHDLGPGFSSQSTAGVTSSAPEPGCGTNDPPSPLRDVESDEAEPVSVDGFILVRCSICSSLVKKTLRETYEDQTLLGRPWTFKWQQRFCTWHKKQTAQEMWDEKGYPAINWDQLHQRMRKHDEFLSDILHDQVTSDHRTRLQRDTKQGRKRQKDIVEGTSKFTMGYYGPRGERRVHEYIMNRFANDLRQRSIHDKLILASGIQGGVNGFVHLVLAPHLAELLVKEDLGLPDEDDWEIRAREVLADSTEIGELLWPEEQDKVGEDAYQEHIVEEEEVVEEEEEGSDDEDLLNVEDSNESKLEDEVEVVEID